MSVVKNTWISKAIAVTFILLFLYAGIYKLVDYQVFKYQIEESPILSNYSSFLAIMLLTLEFTLVLLLAVPKWRLAGFYLGLVLMTAFTGYIIEILRINQGLPCSCGGVIELLSPQQHILFNLVFVLLAGIGIRREIFDRRSLESINKTSYAISRNYIE